MAFEPWLYVALAAGVVAGRFLPHPGAWAPRATFATVTVLVGLLGATLSSAGGDALLLTVPLALAFVAAVLGITTVVYLVLARDRRPLPPPPDPSERRGRFNLSLGLLAALGVGYLLGIATPLPAGTLIPYALYALLALVGFDLRLHLGQLRRVWLPVTAAVVGSAAAALLFWLGSGVSLPVTLATGFAFGWYTLAGPLVSARAGAVLGLLAFLTNFLRENLTMLLSPLVGRRLRGPGVAALGGATAMDTTLFFVTRYGDEESGSLALASGLILTLAASLILPAVLSLPT